LSKISDVLEKYDQTLLDVIGHTDSSGDTDYNQDLSVKRAKTVAQYFVNTGVKGSRINFEGRGELEPKKENDTAANRRLNRRVEIDILPVSQEEASN